MAEKNCVAALLAQMATTVALIDGLIAKAKGQPLPEKPEPAAPLEDGSRQYTVSDWMPSCSKCGRRGRCGEMPRECGQASWFPIFHRVALTIRGGEVERATCQKGRKGDEGPCKAGCKHIDRAKEAFAGLEARGVDTAIMFRTTEQMPKCPNCRERWGVTAKAGKFECRNPVCVRDGRPWRFEEGSTDRPPPMRNELVIQEREPGRVVRKSQQSKRWGA